MSKPSICFIGFFATLDNQLDGQIIKTRQIRDLIKTNLPEARLSWFDTQTLKRQRKRNLLKMLFLILKAKIIIYLPGQNNLSQFFPFLFSFCSLFRKKIIYPVVGGWLADFIKDKPSLQSKLSEIDAILVESNSLKEKLINWYGFKNVEVLPNFRNTNFSPPQYHCEESGPVKIVFMARIMPQKGCDLLIDFANWYQSQASPSSYKIDVYGPLDSDCPQYFYEVLDRIKSTPNIEYCGSVKPENVFSVLSNYDLMALPTSYEGEGFPGSIIDSYIAGIPVLVSRWKDLPEFVEEGKSGFTVNLNNKLDFLELLKSIIENPTALRNLKKYIPEIAQKYSKSTAWNTLKKFLA